MGPVAQKTITELGMLVGKPPVVSVSPHMPTLMAYDLMAMQGVSGAPVVTDEGELIANLSVSDLRALTAEHMSVLALPVAEFLALEHNTAYIGYSANASSSSKHPFFASSKRTGGPKKDDIHLYTVDPTASLLQTLHAFVDAHIHRLYVTVPGSDVLKVEAVLTLTDVLRLLAGVW
jgi:5'-AMP-activated protein kinase regulatory gamma subunit